MTNLVKRKWSYLLLPYPSFSLFCCFFVIVIQSGQETIAQTSIPNNIRFSSTFSREVNLDWILFLNSKDKIISSDLKISNIHSITWIFRSMPIILWHCFGKTFLSKSKKTFSEKKILNNWDINVDDYVQNLFMFTLSIGQKTHRLFVYYILTTQNNFSPKICSLWLVCDLCLGFLTPFFTWDILLKYVIIRNTLFSLGCFWAYYGHTRGVHKQYQKL